MNLTLPQLIFTWTVLAIGINVFLVGCYAAWKFGDWAYDKLTTPRKMIVPPLVDDILTDPLSYLTIPKEKKPPEWEKQIDDELERREAQRKAAEIWDTPMPTTAEALAEVRKENRARETARRQALSHATTCMPYGGEYTSHGSTIMPPQINEYFPYESVTKDHVDAMFPQRFDYYRHK